MKNNKKTLFKIALISLVTMLALVVFCSCDMLFGLFEESYEIPEGSAEFHFVDIGQGDATLILANDKSVLIDTGERDSDNVLINYIKDLGLSTIDYFFVTHFDSDHFGEGVEVLDAFNVKNVVIPDQVKTTQMYENFLNALDEHTEINLTIANDIVGQSINVGELELKILAPLKNDYDDSNDYSITMIARWGNNKFLLSGDAEADAEEDIVNRYSSLDLNCDVFKAGHHGSRTSSSEALLNKATPDTIVISCGEDNKYGHPHTEAMERFESIGAQIYRTDKQGTIIFTTDGENITVETEK